jgi:parallel beta-helix repeat protein
MHRDGMRRKTVIVAVIVILLFTNYLSFLSLNENCRAVPVTLYVGEGEQYTTISAAIENASAGYRIFVYNGTYYENLIIDKKLDLFGEDRSITIINGNGNNDVIAINARNVNISHFTIKNGGNTVDDCIIKVNFENSIITDNIVSNGYHGIILNNSDGHLIFDNIIRYNSGDGIRLSQSDSNVNISYNTITSNNNGIYLFSSDGNKIYNNDNKNNNANGVFLNKTCDNNYIVNNNASDNDHSGIYLNDYSNYSTISNNKVYSNSDSGIKLENCSLNSINNGNIVSGNLNYGIMIIGSNNIIQGNTMSNNNKDGLYLTADDNNTISANTFSYNTLAGIRLYNSTYDYIYDNEIYNNNAYGAYLDFFTKENQVSNNYFHDNTQNAMDKSTNRNTWNITKTSATNIVGGSYKSGNYWDDYDETSEGASDSDGDGIADSSYTIYASNKDNGPLLDVTLPSISSIGVTPTSQQLGSYTNINVTVTDNIEVRNVYLVVTDPNAKISNFSITQNKTGSTYYCNKQFSPVGTYSFSIAAKDPRNWGTSSSNTFNITSGTPPTIVDNSPNAGSPNSAFVFYATVIDDEDGASDLKVNVIWNHSSKGANQSMINIAGNFFERTVTLDKSIDSLTYNFYAEDQWGNSATVESKTVTITDTQPPVITVERYGTSFDDLPNSYTFAVSVTDDSVISDVYIEYWYDGSDYMTADMNFDTSEGDNNYNKVIIPEGSPERILCVIYANDTSDNQNNTKNPFANLGGPDSGFVLEEVTFNGTESFDLDGTITDYSWDFGDGTIGSGITPTHAYNSDGDYIIALTVTDDEGRTGTNRASINISGLTPHKIPTNQLSLINNTYNIALEKQFYCYDAYGTGIVDTFYDPNGELFSVHTDHVNISGNISFLLSIGDDDIPEFFWNTTTDEIISITHSVGIVDNVAMDEENEQVTKNIIVNKANWVYIEIDDEYPYATLTVITESRTISSDFIWRKNDKIYVFDDPETKYQFIFENIYPAVESPTFSPSDGGIINEDSPTITISFNVPVIITSAVFGSFQVTSEFITTDNKIFTYSPLPYLEDGTYTFEIDAQAVQGNTFISSSAVYFYFAYAAPPQESFIEKNWMLITLGAVIAAVAVTLIIFRYKQVTLDDFIYIKNKKILPFFRTIIYGPVSVNVDNTDIAKAEFYVDGKLRETLTSPPYLWKWNEKAFLKHTLETKVYDQEGNSASSGEMTFYIFNLSKR